MHGWYELFTSVSVARENNLICAIRRLAERGIRKIELTAAGICQDGWQTQARQLQEQYKLTYRVHHFCPPSNESFYLNLGSLDERVWKLSILKARKCLRLAQSLGDGVYGIHAPVFADPVFQGNRMLWLRKYCVIMPSDQVVSRFWESLEMLHNEFPDVKIYVENNCWSLTHYREFGGEPIAAFLDASFLDTFTKRAAVPMCDIGHLHTVCERRKFDFYVELLGFARCVDYWHVNGNDGKEDRHGPLKPTSPFLAPDVIARLKRHSTLDLVVEAASFEAERQTRELLLQALG